MNRLAARNVILLLILGVAGLAVFYLMRINGEENPSAFISANPATVAPIESRPAPAVSPKPSTPLRGAMDGNVAYIHRFADGSALVVGEIRQYTDPKGQIVENARLLWLDANDQALPDGNTALLKALNLKPQELLEAGEWRGEAREAGAVRISFVLTKICEEPGLEQDVGCLDERTLRRFDLDAQGKLVPNSVNEAGWN